MLNESDTRSKLIDPALYTRGWREDNIKREETAGAVEMRDGASPGARADGLHFARQSHS
jgi:type I site-specific restriction endonuclease